jgi:hypothetical protein
MIISDKAGYKLYCEVRKLNVAPYDNHVRIFTTYAWARNPDAEQNKLELVMSDAELAALKQALTAV